MGTLSIFNKKTFDKVSKITGTDYEPIEVGEYAVIDINTFESIIEDLICEYETLQEKYDDRERDIKDNYEPKKTDDYEYYGVSRSDFV